MAHHLTNEHAQSSEVDENFVALIASSQLALSTFLRTLLRQQSDIDDVLQETNLVLWRKRAEYNSERPFLAWACRVAQLQALAHYKLQAKHHHQVMNEALLEAIGEVAVKHVGKINRHQQALQECLKELPDHYRVVVRQRYQNGASVAQIAKSSGRTPNALSMLLHRMRAMLKDCIERRLKMEVA